MCNEIESVSLNVSKLQNALKNLGNNLLLLGHPRSGTNWLKNILASHLLVWSLTEPLSLHMKEFMEFDGEQWTEEHFDPKILHKMDKFSEPSAKRVQHLIKEFKNNTEGIALIKETTLLMKLDWLKGLLGSDQKILFLTRNPFSVVASICKKIDTESYHPNDVWNYGQKYEKLISQYDFKESAYSMLIDRVKKMTSIESRIFTNWFIKNVEALRILLNDYPNHKIVRYEDINERREESISEILEFMGLKISSNVVSCFKESQSETRGNAYSSKRKNEDQTTLITENLNHESFLEIRELLTIGESVLDLFGIDSSFFDFRYVRPQKKIGRKFNLWSKSKYELDATNIKQEIYKNPIELKGQKITRDAISNRHFACFLNSNRIINKDGGTYKYYNYQGENARIELIHGKYTVEQGYDNHPVTYVNYNGAVAFASWLETNLPGLDFISDWSIFLKSNPIEIDSINIGEKIGSIIPSQDVKLDGPMRLLGNVSMWYSKGNNLGSQGEFGSGFNDFEYSIMKIIDTKEVAHGAGNLGFRLMIK